MSEIIDADEFIKLVRSLDEKSLRRGLRAGVGKAMRVVTKRVMAEAKTKINFNRKGSWVASKRLGGMKVWRKPLYKEVYQFVWKKNLGATSGILAPKGNQPSRAYILRILDQGTKRRDAKSWKHKKSGRVIPGPLNRGSVRALNFFKPAVNASWREAQSKLTVYTVDGLRKLMKG